MKNLFRTLVVIMASVAIMSCQKEESSTSLSFIENTQWFAQFTAKHISGTSLWNVPCAIAVSFLEGGECVYAEQIYNDSPTHSKGKYTVSSDNKTVTLTFEAEGGGIITETGVISADGITMIYQSASFGELTLTKKES